MLHYIIEGKRKSYVVYTNDTVALTPAVTFRLVSHKWKNSFCSLNLHIKFEICYFKAVTFTTKRNRSLFCYHKLISADLLDKIVG